MTTLLNQLSPLPGTCTVSLSANTGTPGDVLSTITIDGEVMTVVMGIGSENFIVDRGADPAVHVVGASVTYASGVLTAGVLTGPSGYVSLAVGGVAQLVGNNGTGSDGGNLAAIQGGDDAHGGVGAFIDAGGADGAGGDGILEIRANGEFGAVGQALGVKTEEQTEFVDLITVVHAPPSAFVTTFMFDDTGTTGGTYAWTGSAYVKTGLATT